MIDEPTISASGKELTTIPSNRVVVWAFVVFVGLLRLALLNINQGEYSDGVLQITQFERTDSFWPPLYTALVWLLRQVGLETLTAGRLVSWGASVLLVPLLWWTTRLWAGRRAAFFTLAVYAAAPLAMRWSVRVMTDMLFTTLLYAACTSLLILWSRARPSHKIMHEVTRDHSLQLFDKARRHPGTTLIVATLLAVAATLTRYQGLLLLPPLLGTLLGIWKYIPRTTRIYVCAAQGAWLLLPAWLQFQQFGHVDQVVGRTSEFGIWQTLLNYWNLGEMFLYILPYILTLPIFAFFVLGLAKGPVRNSEQEANAALPLRWLLLYVGLAVVVAQAIFQSFQTRYLLPALPLVWTVAGAGFAQAERLLCVRGDRGHKTFAVLATVALIWSLGFALTSTILQRQAFADIYTAGKYIQALNLPQSTPIYTNERYGNKAGMDGINLAFAAGRQVKLMPEAEAWMIFYASGGTVPIPLDLPAMEPDSIIVVSSRNALGMQSYSGFLRFLQQRYELTPMPNAIFNRSIVPLLPDIMAEAGSEQNPIAWAAYRYQPQIFQTRLLRVGTRIAN